MAAQGLWSKGIESFLPRHVVRRRWSDGMKVVSEPIFAGYIFCRTSLAFPVLAVPGFKGFVTFAGRPQGIPDHEIQGIMRMAASGLPLEPEGILWECEAGSQLVVGGEMRGRSAAVKVDRSVLEAL